jgi:hypothetical protein
MRLRFTCLVLVLALLPRIAVLGAQEDGPEADEADAAPESSFGPDVAVLAEGPTAGRELPFLGPNVVEYWRGLYEYQNGRFAVYFTRNEVFGLGDWSAGECGGRDAQFLPRRDVPAELRELREQGRSPAEDADAEEPTSPGEAAGEGLDPDAPGLWHIASTTNGWHLFINVAGFAGDACSIMPLFIERLIFFYDALGPESSDAPLPAVVGASG